MWALYDDLINSIPEDLTALECMLGVSWTLVRSERGIGIAKTIKGGKKGSGLDNVTGMPLKRLAGYAKSWNMLEASLGQAALNSAFNHPSEVLTITGKPVNSSSDSEGANAFKLLEPEIYGKKVAVIGHFPEVELLQEKCELSILERDPQGKDYPDPACEYLLPEQDFVFITGTAFTNKTMPRLLELAQKAKVILVGPSVPISNLLFKYGVDYLASFVVLDPKLIWEAGQIGKKMDILKQGGQMVCIQR
ncbi:Rossmann-like domain-containing protein [Desulfitobacterium sp. AusDCA]|uniref:Rossmann-like domain-containing protein n=1 Tax=Desulfitobacterium sp. AusDCA TaxID=3240383 RepID=UPI003DA6F666